MKGKKGGESPKAGITFAEAPIPCTSKSNILSAAKRRKRGGAVSAGMPPGMKAKARLDKPSRKGMDKHDPRRASGGGVSERSSEDYHDLAREYGIKSPGKHSADQPQTWKDRVDNVHSQAQRTGKVNGTYVSDASRYAGPKARAKGGMVEDAEKAAGKVLAGAEKAKKVPPPSKIGTVLGSKVHSGAMRPSRMARMSGDDTPERQRGGRVGKIGADTSPMTHAASKRPMKGHMTQPNVT